MKVLYITAYALLVLMFCQAVTERRQQIEELNKRITVLEGK